MQYMNLFGDIFSDDEAELIITSQQTISDFENVKQQLINTKYKAASAYLQDVTSLGELVLIAKAYDLGPEYADALKDGLTFEEQKVALFGFQQGLNVMEQIKGGEELDNLVLLIRASKHKDFKLMDYFDSTGSYINYPKITKFLQNL